MVDEKRGLAVLLIDALAYPYLESMPWLCGQAERGQAYSVKPAAGFRGVEPALNGEWTLPGEVPFRFRFELSGASFPSGPPFGERLLPGSIDRIYRLLLARATGKSDPFLIPSRLLPFLSTATGTSRKPKAIEDWESRGLSVWWYTRDSAWENKKALTARIYRALYRRRMLEEAVRAFEAGKDVVYLEFSTALDGVGHRYGPGAEETRRAAATLDRELEAWVLGVRKIRPNLSWVVLSDHGMSPVGSYLPVERTLSERGYKNGVDYIGVWNSNFGQIVPIGEKPGLSDSLDTMAGVFVLAEDERETWFGPDLSYGVWIVACEEGTIFLPNHFQGSKKVRGMHGYLNASSPDSRALFLHSGDGFEGLDRVEVEMPELYPVLATWGA